MPKGCPKITYTSQKSRLFVLGEITCLSCRCSIMHGMFTIMRKKATKFRMLKMPATTYSWKAAEIVNVTSRHALELHP